MNHFKSVVSMLSICCLLDIKVAADPIDTVLSAGKVVMVTPEKLLTQPQDSLSEDEINLVVNNLANEDYFGHQVQTDEVAYLVKESIVLFANHGFAVFQFKPYYLMQNFGKGKASQEEVIELVNDLHNYSGPFLFFQYSMSTAGQIELELFINWADTYPELADDDKQNLHDLLLSTFIDEADGVVNRLTKATALAISRFNFSLSNPPNFKISSTMPSATYFKGLLAKAALVTQFQTFSKVAEQKTNVSIYFYVFNSPWLYFNVKGVIDGDGKKGVTRLFKNKAELLDNNHITPYNEIPLTDADAIFKTGKYLLSIGIADIYIDPSHNYLANGKSIADAKQQPDPQFQKFASIEAIQTIIHECFAHGLKYLNNANVEGDLKAEHKAYHGAATPYSPGSWEVLQERSSDRYKNSPMLSVLLQLIKIHGYKL
ncbi:hypothetical protein [Haliscomenobacter hydrossis]|uniref:Uncharacterized protein n=1 Tax=Haliscomenobacter hydrossis (strain ATCC 27775 / DSM 1100 / LMG 10767 / O) TaxID=760192 RepID=F4L5N1_HALH1|nr:hypothetical protein [Haliscomenobacter hydrossis]AEE51866.1 hypothetical protein Halhy_4018 [Haliscomenobacter hydrossis DSM 1100]